MDNFMQVLELLASWPGVAVLTVLMLRKPLTKLVDRLISGNESKIKIGPIEAELGKLAEEGTKAVDSLNEINLIVARGKLLELEFAERSGISSTFTETQKRELKSVVKELRLKLRELES
ncbi:MULTISPECIES: hypothetical protein [Vibrio]|uniref:hypothetical protein n=1 Tax=Vibrio TaxID=662 RepID=UPI00168D7F8B|nr:MULTISPECIES: hypothetical protein [Vibrio]MBO0150156.1 hypothetical protein [Vibrio sp. Vb2424]MCR9505478.1 hypothetical protein [Vibrio alginolyticus]